MVTPAIFPYGSGVEVSWYPGYTLLIDDRGVRFFDGKSSTGSVVTYDGGVGLSHQSLAELLFEGGVYVVDIDDLSDDSSDD